MAEQMESAYRTSLAKGEVDIREKQAVPTMAEFAKTDFQPFVQTTFAAKPKTLKYYENGTKQLLAFDKLASEPLDAINTEKIAAYASKRQRAGLKARVAVAFLTRTMKAAPELMNKSLR